VVTNYLLITDELYVESVVKLISGAFLVDQICFGLVEVFWLAVGYVGL
jgi:hypothetical protein